jgi:hypothetical protein
MASRVMNEDIFERVDAVYKSLPNGEIKELSNVLADAVEKQKTIYKHCDKIRKELEDAKQF